jgi:hypothetical protein
MVATATPLTVALPSLAPTMGAAYVGAMLAAVYVISKFSLISAKRPFVRQTLRSYQHPDVPVSQELPQRLAVPEIRSECGVLHIPAECALIHLKVALLWYVSLLVHAKY